MTDPTPDAPTPFERACMFQLAAEVSGRSDSDYDQAKWLWGMATEERRQDTRLGLAAALRELRKPSESMAEAARRKGAWHSMHAWQILLDAVLKDAPNG